MSNFEINLSKERMNVLRRCLKDFTKGNNSALNYEISTPIYIYFFMHTCICVPVST